MDQPEPSIFDKIEPRNHLAWCFSRVNICYHIFNFASVTSLHKKSNRVCKNVES